MTAPSPHASEAPLGPIGELAATIGTFLTFSGTVTHSSDLPSLQRGTSNRRLVVEDHGVRVKTIAGSGWASDVREGDTLTLRGPIKGYEIQPDGLVIVLERTRPLHRAQRDGDPVSIVDAFQGWPPAPSAGARRRFRSQHDTRLRPKRTKKAKSAPKDSHDKD